jgi:hypothetical protein
MIGEIFYFLGNLAELVNDIQWMARAIVRVRGRKMEAPRYTAWAGGVFSK